MSIEEKLAVPAISGADAKLYFTAEGQKQRQELVNHLVGSATALRDISLEDRIKYIDKARKNALDVYRPDESIPYSDEMQTDLYESLISAITPKRLREALRFSAKQASGDKIGLQLYEGDNIEYPGLCMSVNSRNADTFTEAILRLAAGMPVLVKGGPMSISLAKELQKTPLKDSIAVLDWNSEDEADGFYSTLPQNSEVIVSGGILGVEAVKTKLDHEIIVRERNHRRGLGVLEEETNMDAYAKALGFINGFGCLTPGIIFSSTPHQVLEPLYEALVRYAEENGPFCIPNQAPNKLYSIMLGNLMAKLSGMKFKGNPEIGLLAAYGSEQIPVYDAGWRTGVIYPSRSDYKEWINTFEIIHKQLEELGLKGINIDGCGGGAGVDKELNKTQIAAIKKYFEGPPPYNWAQTLVADNPSEDLVRAFVDIGGRRIVSVDQAIPNHCFPVDGEAPIPLEYIPEGKYRFARDAPYFTIRNDNMVIAENGTMLEKPINIKKETIFTLGFEYLQNLYSRVSAFRIDK
ncbi:MAG: acyl-CoA reductase [Nanoarchaeota archaeon]|nr:acyl-CoA reductase [Nanoarchaeota archaeon]